MEASASSAVRRKTATSDPENKRYLIMRSTSFSFSASRSAFRRAPSCEITAVWASQPCRRLRSRRRDALRLYDAPALHPACRIFRAAGTTSACPAENKLPSSCEPPLRRRRRCRPMVASTAWSRSPRLLLALVSANHILGLCPASVRGALLTSTVTQQSSMQ